MHRLTGLEGHEVGQLLLVEPPAIAAGREVPAEHHHVYVAVHRALKHLLQVLLLYVCISPATNEESVKLTLEGACYAEAEASVGRCSRLTTSG